MQRHTQRNRLLRAKSGEGEREERYEAEAGEIQHVGGGFNPHFQSVPDSAGTLDRER